MLIFPQWSQHLASHLRFNLRPEATATTSPVALLLDLCLAYLRFNLSISVAMLMMLPAAQG
jgi:hypothetical protein